MVYQPASRFTLEVTNLLLAFPLELLSGGSGGASFVPLRFQKPFLFFILFSASCLLHK